MRGLHGVWADCRGVGAPVHLRPAVRRAPPGHWAAGRRARHRRVPVGCAAIPAVSTRCWGGSKRSSPSSASRSAFQQHLTAPHVGCHLSEQQAPKNRQHAGKPVHTLRTGATVVILGDATRTRCRPTTASINGSTRAAPATTHLSPPARDTPAGPPTFTPTPERHAQHSSSPADLWDHKDPRPSHPVLKQNPNCKDQG